MSDIGSGWFGRKRKNASRSKANSKENVKENLEKKPRSRRSGIIALEPRMMYDGAAHATAGAAGHHHHHDIADQGHMFSAEKNLAQTPNVQTPNVQTPNVQTPASTSSSGTSSEHTNIHTPDTSREQWHHQSSEPMPHVTTWVKNPTEIVFIDPQAPDYQILAAGVKPGIEVVVLDPNSDGVQQIANFLARHPDPNLTTIDIVAHGENGMLFLGNVVLDNDTVSQYAAQLKIIGGAMQPGGDLMLYGCDVAASSDGLILLDQIVQATGANVAASAGPVGSSAEGGTWSLDVTAGPIDATNPFTAATQAMYPDVLNADLIGIISDAGNGDGIVTGTDANGSTPGAATNVAFTKASGLSPQSGSPQQVQLDVTDGLYFVLLQQNGIHGAEILEGSLSQVLGGGTPTFTTIYQDTSLTNDVNAFQVDVADNVIFFNHLNNANTPTASDTVEVLTFSGAHFAGTATAHAISTNMANTDLVDMVVDPVNHVAYFYETQSSTIEVGSGGHTQFGNPATKNGGIATGTKQTLQTIITNDQLFKGTWTGGNGASSTGFTLAAMPIAQQGNSSTLGSNNLPTSLGQINDLAIDTVDQVLYFDTNSINGSSSSIFSYSLSAANSNTGGAGAFNTVWTQTAAVPGQLLDLVIDPQTSKYYISVQDGNNVGKSDIYDGSLTGGAAPAKFITVNTSGDPELLSLGLAVDNTPTVTTSASTVVYNAGTAPVTVDHPGAGISISDSSGTAASATVSITSNFQSGDVLGIPTADLTGTTVTGTSITESYNSATGVLTLTGTDSLAHYQTALSEVTFSSTLAAPSTTPRVITFAAKDGFGGGTSATDTVDVFNAPNLTATAANPTFFESLTTPIAVALFSGAAATVPAGDAITELQLTVSGLSGSDNEQLVIDGTAVSLTNGNSVTTTAHSDHVAVSVSGNVATVTITDPGTNFTTTTAQTLVNGLAYQDASSPLTTGSRTVTLTSIQDNDTSGAPTSKTLSIASTVTVDAVNHPPSLIATADNPSFSEGGTPVTLFGSAAVSANDSGQGIEQLQLTVSNVVDGANEKLQVDGSLVTLTNGTSVITADNDHVSVSVSGSTATVTITNTLTSTATDTLVDGLAYQDTSATLTAGTRTVTLTKIEDTGGTAHGGNDTTTLAVASIVTLANGPVVAAGSKSETGSVTEIAGVTGSTTADTTSGTINFTDSVLTDVNTSSASLISAVSSGNPVPAATMTALGSALATVLAETNGTGTVNWNFSLADSNLDFLGASQTLTVTYHVTISNGNGGSDTATVTITATGTNDAAVISGTTTGDVTEAGGVGNNIPGTPTATGLLTDTDVDNPTNTFAAVPSTLSDHGFGSYTMTAGGTWAYTLNNNNAFVQSLNVGQVLTDTFTVDTVDGTAQLITITIHGANDAAVIAGTNTGDVTEAGGVNNNIPGTPTTSGTLTDTDVDNPANTFSAVTTATPSSNGFGSFTMTSTGTWTYTLDNTNATVQALNAGQTLTDTFTVDTLDGTPQSITITIHGANDAAVVSGATTGDVTEAGGVNNNIPGTPTTSGTLTDTDVDNPANTFTAAASTLSDHGFGNFTMTPTGTWTYTLDNTNAFVQSLNVGQVLTDTFTVDTADGTAQQVTITIHGANDAAVISGTNTGDVTEAGGVSNNIPGTPTTSGTLTDTDVDNPANIFTPVTTATPSSNGFGSFTMTSTGTWTYALDNTNATVQALNAGQTLTDTFTVDTVDGTPESITITIHGANDAAVVSGATTGDVTEAGGVNNNIPGTPTTSGTLTDTDVDNPANTFTAAASTLSDHGFGDFTMTASGTWSYTLDNTNATVQALNVGQTLTDTFTVDTADGTAQQVTITIHGANDAAVISGTNTGDVTEAGGVNNNIPGTPTTSGALTDTDIDNTANTFTAVTTATPSDHAYGSFTMTAGGTWSYTLDNTNATVQALNVGQTLTDTFTVDTLDGTPESITITIHGANDAAVVGGTDTGTVVEAGGVGNNIPGTPTTSGTLTDTDVDNPANTFTAVNAATASDHGFGDFTMASNGTWTYTLDNTNAAVQALNVGQTLTDTFTVDTVDGTAHQVTVTIDGANDAATVSGTTTGTVVEAGGISNTVPGLPVAFGVLTDTDIDNPANKFTTVTTLTPSDHFGSFTMTSGGLWTYVVDNNNSQVQALNFGQTLTDTFTVTTIDGTAQKVTITIDGTNDSPVATAGNTVNFDANGSHATAIDAAISVHDVDNATLAGAQVAITGGFDAGQDSLGFVSQNGISGSFNSRTGVLTLTGTASVADYQAALASVTFNSTSTVNGVRTVQWTVDDGSALFQQSLPTTTTVIEQAVFAPPHPGGPPHFFDANPNTTLDAPVSDNGPTFLSASFTDTLSGIGSSSSFSVVHVEPTLTTADANVQINLAVASLAAPLGGEVASIQARQADGSPLPDWLKFDPATGTFAGTPPDNAVASLAPDQSSDIVTGALRPDFDGGSGQHSPGMSSITVEVLARDAKGNVVMTVFTIDLHHNGKHGWNMQPFGTERHAALAPPLSPELAAIEAAVRDATRTIEPFGLHGMPVRHGDAISTASHRAAPAGRAGLTEQMASIGWRSMAAQRNALLASLRQGR